MHNRRAGSGPRAPPQVGLISKGSLGAAEYKLSSPFFSFPQLERGFPPAGQRGTLGAQPKSFPEERTRLLQPLLERLPKAFMEPTLNHQSPLVFLRLPSP